MSNFIVLMSDEHNPLYSEPYGHKKVKTPNMQALAAQGTVFKNAYCPSPLCMPSRSAFLSGKRVHDLQTYSNCNLGVDPSPVSFGAALSNQGIYSVYIGKTDVYTPGNKLGFNEMIRPGDRKSPGDTNHRRSPTAIREGAAKRADGFGVKDEVAQGDITIIDEAVSFIKERAPGLETPWVLTININNPHFPHLTLADFWEMYQGCEDLPELGPECESAQHPYAQMLRKHFETDKFTEEQIRGLRRGYLACISFVDHQLGRLMDSLKAAGLSDSTNIVYTSDHGDMLGKFGMWWKCSLYEDSVRIPMIAAGPDFEKGKRVSTPVDLHDLQATLFAATGTEQPRGWLGQSLTELPSADTERVVFSEYHGHGAPGSCYMIRKGQWKYIHYFDAPCQLFDLKNDPDELKDLSGTEPEIIKEMRAELITICSPDKEHERAEIFIENQLKTIAENKFKIGTDN